MPGRLSARVAGLPAAPAAAALCLAVLPASHAPAQVGGFSSVQLGQQAGAPDQSGSAIRYYPHPAYTLPKVWPDLVWDAARLGPLIVVEPPNTLPFVMMQPGVRRMPLPPPEKGPDGYAAATLRDYFGLKAVTLPTLTALAPSEMVVLNTKPGKADLLRGMGHDDRLRMLEASLTQAQWRALSSPQGLGVNNLNPDQQTLFASLLPDPFRIQRSQSDPNSGGQRSMGPPVTLPPDARAGVRLRLTREVSISFPAANAPNGWVSANNGRIHPDGDVFSVLPSEFGPRTFSAPLAVTVPNRAKPGNLAFDSPALNARMSLEPAATGAAGSAPRPLTVGELVRRAAEATRVELYADPRAAAHVVLTRGDSARAGDVLRALSLCVTGTFRKVGPAFVLTDDLQGLGARRMLLDEWLRDAEAQLSALTSDSAKQLDGSDYLRSIGFSENAELPLPADRMNAITPGQDPFSGKPADVAIADLPAAWQERLRGEARRINLQQQEQRTHLPPEVATHMTDFSVRDDHARIGVRLSLTYLVPGVGAISSDSQFGGIGMTTGGPLAQPAGAAGRPGARPEPPPTPPLAPALNRFALRALYLAPANADEAVRSVREAKQHGFTQVWLATPPGGEALLKAAVEAGKEQQLPVVAVVPAMLRGAREAPAELTDVDLLGETASAHAARRANSPDVRRYPPVLSKELLTADWLRCDRSEAVEAIEQPILAAARVPGLAGLVVRYSAPPGYRDSAQHDFVRSTYGETDLGYTPDMRLAFLRRASADPIDIPPAGSSAFSMGADLPYFSDRALQPGSMQISGEPQPTGEPLPRQWARFRYETATALLRDLHAKLRATHPDLPLLLDDRTDLLRGSGFFALWDRPDAIPDPDGRPTVGGPIRLRDGAGPNALLRVRPYTRSYRGASLPPGGNTPPEKPDAFATSLAFQLDREAQQHAEWQGLVVDLSEAPLDRALAQLAGFPEGR